MTDLRFPRVAALKTPDALRRHLTTNGITLEFDDTLTSPESSPLAAPLTVEGFTIGNRFSILPMEGWDGTTDGQPSELTTRRWKHFGSSGAKLIWGGEAVAICHEGRANPNQLGLQSFFLEESFDMRHRQRERRGWWTGYRWQGRGRRQDK